MVKRGMEGGGRGIAGSGNGGMRWKGPDEDEDDEEEEEEGEGEGGGKEEVVRPMGRQDGSVKTRYIVALLHYSATNCR
uniref:Uncharacterized protein n=1 Tax=Vespula pensylvanica TaxID=30213 RepID=A0A834U9S1_VESPE|nr:hypothetical protein H0235_007612 [Vespula pensylvanica]